MKRKIRFSIVAGRFFAAIRRRFFDEIHQGHYRTVDLVVGGAIGSDPQQVIPSIPGMDSFFVKRKRLNHVAQQFVEVGDFDAGIQFAQSSSNISLANVEDLSGGGGGSAHSQCAVDHHDRNLNAAQDVGEVAVDLKHLEISVAQL